MKKLFITSTTNAITFISLLILLSFIYGCTYYFKVQTKNNITSQEFQEYDSLNRYFILHQGNFAWNLTDIQINNNELSGNLIKLPDEHFRYLTVNPERKNRYQKNKPPYESVMLSEVHLYLHDSLLPVFKTGDHIKIDFSLLSKAEVYQKAKGATTASWLIPAVGIPVLAVAIIATTKSSCPLIYIRNDHDFTFAGEIFGGAVYSSLERDDYLPLPGFKPSNNQYILKISNKLPEIQYINHAELIIVGHPENINVLPDRYGKIHTFNRLQPPMEAYSSANSDLLELVEKKDHQWYLFDEDPSQTGDTSAFNNVFLSFSVPDNANTGKLFVSAGNSDWGDYTYGEFTKLFGSKYDKWIKKQRKEPAEKNIQWMKDQCLVLMVYLETNTGWQFVDYFDLIGPLGARDMIMPVDLSQALNVSSSEHERMVRIRLESGFKFWELDYTGMDFSRDSTVMIEYIKPHSAITESGKDVTKRLTQNDDHYYIQKDIGEESLVVYLNSPDIQGMEKSDFLHTKGYYEHVRDYPGPPNNEQLLTFLIPGRFSKFSFENHYVFVKENYVFASDQHLP